MIETPTKRIQWIESNHPTWERLTLNDRFDALAKRYANRVYLFSEDETYTYRESSEIINRLAKGLIALGVQPREHIALLMDNRPEYVFLSFAIAKVGAVKVPLNTRLNKQDLAYTLSQSDSSYFITIVDGFINKEKTISRENLVREILVKKGNDARFTQLKKIITISDEGKDVDPCLSFETLLSMADSITDKELTARKFLASCPDDIAEIMYTSGSTGEPKGVMITHDMLWRSAFASAFCRAFQDGRRIMIPVPLFHIFAYKGLLATSMLGGSAILQKRFCAEETLSMIHRYQANDLLCVPQILQALLDQPSLPGELSSLHAVLCTSAPTPKHVWKQVRDRFGVTEISTNYGLTEVCGATIYTEIGAPLDIVESRVGKMIPVGVSGLPEFRGCQAEYKVIDPFTGKELPAGAVGELSCRGCIVTPGYYKKPLETAHARDKDGWLRSGDIGRIHADGYFELVGRSSELYKTNGENVSPREIEKILEKHPAVKTCAVVGIPDERLGEVGVAFIECDPVITEKDVVSFCRQNIASFKVPKFVHFLSAEEFPRTANMKIMKHKLREQAIADVVTLTCPGN